MMQWQPIETAPKDGTKIVLWCAATETLFMRAYWHDRFKWMVLLLDDPYDCGFGELAEPHTPTHWLKIEPPKETRAEEEPTR